MPIIEFTDITTCSHCKLDAEMKISPSGNGYSVSVRVEDKTASGYGATQELAEQAGNEIMAGLVMEVLYAP